MSRWLFSFRLDILLLFIPVWLCWLAAFLMPAEMRAAEAPLWVWVVFVIGIDVSHVWSSIHRTYLDEEEFGHHKRLLMIAPILSFALAFGIAVISIDWFWRCLAYVALYHFVKQQYGFNRIYKARMGDFRKKVISDDFIIYLSMLYPIVFWHLNPGRRFAWFVDGDFFSLGLNNPLIFQIANGCYFFLIAVWLIEELVRAEKIPIGKILWVLTTAGNWFLGIVFFNSDIVFTITNVVAHGLPYLALVVIYQHRKHAIKKTNTLNGWKLVTWIVGSVMVLALVEEYLWDFLVYRENEAFFSKLFPYLGEEPAVFWQWVFIGLLAVPQITHYILDGFIWKSNEKNPYLKKTILS